MTGENESDPHPSSCYTRVMMVDFGARLNAASHSTCARHDRKIAFRLLAHNYGLIAQLGFPCTVMDAGCATGETSKLLAYFANVSEVVAIDESIEMLAVAETFHQDERIRYVHADLGDYASLPVEAHMPGFDVVCSFGSLHWMREPLRGLATLARSVRIGGLLIGYTLAEMPETYARVGAWLNEVNNHNVPLPMAPWFFDNQPEQSMGEAIESIGFQVLECNLEDDEIIYTRKEAIGTLLMLKNTRIDDDSQLIDEYLEMFDRLPDDNYAQRIRIITFVGRKICNI